MQFRQEDSQDTNLIDIDHPTPEPEAPLPDRIPSPEVAPSPYASPYTIGNLSGISSRSTPITKNDDEYSSPAWAKRGRISYGSLFDKEYDPFEEEDGSIRGKGRKRTRLSSMWRYQSRSPSPEAEQDTTLDTSPEPAPRPAPTMTDEGSQTVGLEDGDAAEVLAGFHKQATNVRSASYRYANGRVVSEAQPQGESESELHEKPAEPPTIQTQFEGDEAMEEDGESRIRILLQKVPVSPRLQPVSSDSLPLVSPLVTNKYSELFGTGPPERVVSPVPTFSEQAPTPVEEPVIEEEQEDLYGASPAAIHGQAHMSEFDGFQDSSVNAVEEDSSMQGQFLSKDQYSHWQAANTHLSRGGSPHKTEEEQQQDGIDEEEREEVMGFQNNGFPISTSGEPHVQQYPDPEETNYGQPLGTSWGRDSTTTAYPDLPELEEGYEGDHAAQQALHPRPVAMSRSGSAQSAAIDLTESDEEADEEEYEKDVPFEPPIGEEGYELSKVPEEGIENEVNGPKQQRSLRMDGYRPLEEETSDEDEENGSLEDQPTHDRQLPNNSRLYGEEDGSQNSQDEEELYEEEIYEEEFVEGDGEYERYPPGFDPEQEEQFDEEDEEGSYDEEMEKYDQPTGRPVERDPVVIDLLSSDDEDGGEPAPPRLEPDTPPRQPVEAEEDERSESDEDMDAEQDFSTDPQNQAFQQLTREQSEDEDEEEDENERFAVEDDESMVNAEEDDDLPDTGDEASTENDASDSGDSADKPAKSHQGTEMAQANKTLQAEDDASDGGSDTEHPTEVDQDTEMAQPDETLETKGHDEAPEEVEPIVEADVEEVMEEGGPEMVEEVLSSARHVRQEVTGNPAVPKSEEEHKDPGPSNVEAPIEPSSANLPPPPASFAQMFNLDGANDERLPSLYPVLPMEDVRPTPEALPSEPTSQLEVSVDAQYLRQANGQLLTPEATQLSLMGESSEISLSSFTGQTEPSGSAQNTSSELPIDPALENAPLLMEEDKGALVDDTAANLETKTTSTEAIDEETSKITLEEDFAEIAQGKKLPQVVVESHNLRPRTRQQNGSVEPVIHEEVQALEQVVVEPHNLRSRTRQQTGSLEPVAQDEAQAVEQVATLRRGHRRDKSTSSAAETPLVKAPTTPSKSATTVRQDEPVSARTDRSSLIMLDEQTTPKGHDASIELAMSALDSPVRTVKETHALRSKQPGGDMKLKLSRSLRTLRTELSEFTSLKVLRFHNAQKLDVLVVATTVPTEPERAKGGPRHYQITFNVTDQSIAAGGASSPVTEVQVFRPYKDALPIIRAGDGVLLRNFLVVSAKNKGFVLQSTDASSWAVFRGDEKEDVEVRGPPVEYGAGEQKHISMLRAWYDELEQVALEKITKANGEKGSGKGKGV